MVEAIKNIGNESLFMLACWLVFLLGTVITYFKKKSYTSYFLFASAISIAAAYALFSPYLFLWDEQFHALVAKNLANHPFVPKLYENHPLVVHQIWVNTEIWMHKQPLFTWQMALSIKLLGTSAFAIRFPSVLFHGILVLCVFRIGILVFNRKTGFIAALLVMNSSFLLGMVSGKVGTDHNDFIFLVYITLSFWAWFEWNASPKKKWLYWIGIFVGCAILTKWLVGLLVFAGWSIVILSKFKKGNFWISIKPLLIAFSVCILIALPWQIYTFLKFPILAKQEMAYNAAHIFTPIESHAGSAWFHFEQLRNLYFDPIQVLIFLSIGIGFIFVRKIRKEYKIQLIASIAVLYLFFTIVQTKMPSFTAPVYCLVVLIIAFGLTETMALIRFRKIQLTALLFVFSLLFNWMIKPGQTLSVYGFYKDKIANNERRYMLEAYELMNSIGKDDAKRVVFGADFYPYSNISWMFFNDEIVYPFLPTREQKGQLEKRGYEVFIVQNK